MRKPPLGIYKAVSGGTGKVKPTDGAGAVYPDIDHNRDSAAVVCMLFYQYMDSVSEIRHGNFIKGLMIYLLYTFKHTTGIFFV